ncbi:efflux RND transporter periplasmic adaptor subunit [Lachnospiraceae bacterium C1.1]|nr:efflux RND transporter periplasmic adaptor subunit [Lachnospiraceae bacterium C1.1]
MKKAKLSKILAITISLTITATAATGCASPSSSAEATESQEEALVEVETANPGVGNLSISSNFAATVEAASEVIVVPKTSGEVTSKNFEVGDHVNEGDLLFTIDDESAQISLAQAQASVASAQAGVNSSTAAQQASQYSALETLGTMSTTEQQLANAVDSAKASVASAANTLASASETSDYYNDQADDSDDDVSKYKKKRNKLKSLIDDYYAAPGDQKDKVLQGSGYSSIDSLETAYQSYKDKVESAESSKDSNKLQSDTYGYNAATAEQNYYTAQEAQALAEKKQQDYENYTKGTTIAGVQSSLASAQANVDTSKASLEQANASLDSAKLALEYTQVTAPVSGTITDIDIELHNMASSGSQAYVIQSDAKNKIVFYVAEETAKNITVGNEAVVTKNATDYDAVITYVGNTVDSEKKLFKIEASISGSSDLINGSEVRIRTITRESRNALTVPVSAVYYDGEQAYVYLNDNGVAEIRNITVGINGDTEVEVKEGLSADDEVITSYSTQLNEGVKLSATKKNPERSAALTNGGSGTESVSEIRETVSVNDTVSGGQAMSEKETISENSGVAEDSEAEG